MSEELRIIATWSHSDSVSGTSVFSDGTKAYWTEGRGSSVAALTPDGKRIELNDWDGRFDKDKDMWIVDDPYMRLLNGDEYGAHREMTDVEELEHSMARRGAL